MKAVARYTALAALLLAVLGLYMNSAHPFLKNNDSPEIVSSAVTLGIAHAPGYPVFMTAAKVFSYLPAGSTAFRINIFSSFLSVLVLLVVFFTVKALLRHLKLNGYMAIGCMVMLILAFSGIYTPLSLEAKGGVYILNLLFLSLIILLAVLSFNLFHIKYIYLISFVLGLSLSNHWPSMIILVPVIASVYYFSREELNIKRGLANAAFFIAGISAFMYLPIRAAAGPEVYYGGISSAGELFSYIAREAYSMGGGSVSRQVSEFMRVFNENYSYIWIFGAGGVYFIYKKSLRLFIVAAGILIFTSAAVVFYNRTPAEYMEIFRNFLLPAEYAFLIFICGGTAFILSLLKGKTKGAAVCAISAAVLIYAAGNCLKYNCARNYLVYDHMNNVLKTAGKNSVFIGMGEGDTTYTALQYAGITGIRTVPRLAALGSIIRDKGPEAAANELAGLPSPGSKALYYRLPRGVNELFKKELKGDRRGILTCINCDDKGGRYLFKIYSYRGIWQGLSGSMQDFILSSFYVVDMKMNQ